MDNQQEEKKTILTKTSSSLKDKQRKTKRQYLSPIPQDSALFIESDSKLLERKRAAALPCQEASEEEKPAYVYIKKKNELMKMAAEPEFILNIALIKERRTSTISSMRRILLDWMLQLSVGWNFDRETFSLSVLILDKLLESKFSIPKGKLQLIGAIALLISYKFFESGKIRLSYLNAATGNSYSVGEIIKCEAEALERLGYMVPLVSLSYCGRVITALWDLYVKSPERKVKAQVLSNLPTFREEADKAYLKAVYNVIDLSQFYLENHLFGNNIIVTSLIYLVSGLRLRNFTENEMKESIENSDCSCFHRSSSLRQIIDDFVKFAGLELSDSFETTVNYVSKLFVSQFYFTEMKLGKEETVEKQNYPKRMLDYLSICDKAITG